MNPESPIALPQDIFDDSTGMRTKAYWGNFIGVIFAVPANFLFNKLWTFRVVREKHANTGNSDAVDAVEAVVTGK